MTRRWAAATAVALTLLPAAGCSGADSRETVDIASQNIVSYSREGGIDFRRSTLAVSAEGEAKMRSEGCTEHFQLQASLLRRLRGVLRHTDMEALAGDYPALAGAADLVAEKIIAGGDVVRIGDFASLPAAARQELTPLVNVLREILTRAGPCASP